MFGMRSWIGLLFLFSILQPIARLEAFIFELHSIKKKDHMQSGPDWVIGLGDLHDKKHPINQLQKKIIMNFLSLLPKDQVKVLTEDLSSPGMYGRKGCGNFYINSRGGVLGGFTQDCHIKGLLAENHEFRFCRVSSLGPVLNNLKTDVASLGSTRTIKMAAIHNEIQDEIDRVRSFDDGAALTKVYRQNIHDAQTMLAKLRIMANDQTSVADYLKKQVSGDKRIDFIKSMLTFDSELLDCKLVHAIKQEKNKKYVVIIAGGAHVKRVCDLLTADGYQKHFAILSKHERICEKEKCAGRPFVNNACIAPRAIDLSCLPNCCDIKK